MDCIKSFKQTMFPKEFSHTFLGEGSLHSCITGLDMTKQAKFAVN